MASIFAGTSGWAYASWKPGFYPAKTPTTKFLPYYASQLNSVEVNYTFRQLPTPSMLDHWLAATPNGFRFSFKAPQRITHFKRLVDCEALTRQFVACLEPVRQANKLGLLLFQLPPNLKADTARLRDFLDASADAIEGCPFAFEFRHDSWFTEPVYTLLSEHDAALCLAETDTFETPEVHPAKGHASFRMRRPGGYKEDELARFAERILALAQTRDVYVYFKHEDEPTGALNAVEFLRDIGGAR